MVDYPREVRFAHGKIRFTVKFNYEPAEKAAKCSNPECEDEGVFGVAVVVRQIELRDSAGETIVDPAEPLWTTIASAIQMRHGHGQTHCRTPDSRYCEGALSRQNYISTFHKFGIKINGTRMWDRLIDDFEKKANDKRSVQKHLKKQKALKRHRH